MAGRGKTSEPEPRDGIGPRKGLRNEPRGLIVALVIFIARALPNFVHEGFGSALAARAQLLVSRASSKGPHTGPLGACCYTQALTSGIKMSVTKKTSVLSPSPNYICTIFETFTILMLGSLCPLLILKVRRQILQDVTHIHLVASKARERGRTNGPVVHAGTCVTSPLGCR